MQRSGHPFRKRVVRMPGPSWMAYRLMSKMRGMTRRYEDYPKQSVIFADLRHFFADLRHFFADLRHRSGKNGVLLGHTSIFNTKSGSRDGSRFFLSPPAKSRTLGRFRGDSRMAHLKSRALASFCGISRMSALQIPHFWLLLRFLAQKTWGFE